jgi:hypothetical protein
VFGDDGDADPALSGSPSSSAAVHVADRGTEEGQDGQVFFDIKEGVIAGRAHVHHGALLDAVILTLNSQPGASLEHQVELVFLV